MPVEAFGLFFGQVVDKDALQLTVLGTLDAGKKIACSGAHVSEILFLLGWLLSKVLFPGADGYLKPVVLWRDRATVLG